MGHLAFAEGRKFGCGDFGPGGGPLGSGQHDLVVRRSRDAGRTWGPLRTIVDAVGFWPSVTAATGAENGNAVWDPTPLYDAHTSEIFVFFNGPGRESCAATGLCQTWLARSADAGDTWRAQNVTGQCQRRDPAANRVLTCV